VTAWDGLALHTMASLAYVSVAGATAAVRHRFGPGNPGLPTALAGIELVAATGGLVAVRRG
jgi:xylitol oxidase